MLKQSAILSRAIAFSLFFLVLITSACSMQKPGTTSAESRRSKTGLSAEQASSEQANQEKSPIRVDYLTPLSAIREPSLFVYKEKRRLYVIEANTLVRDYPVGLGFSPSGDKEREGDGRTPEGEFLICVKKPASRFVKSLGLNYPDKKHAERAFFAGALTPVEFRDILLAFEKKVTPPWSTKLGGQIFIHAGGAHTDWTDGCVALYDSDMEELFKLAAVGTPISIRP